MQNDKSKWDGRWFIPFFAGKMRYAKGGTLDSIIASQKGRSTIKQRIGVLRESLRLLLRGNDKKSAINKTEQIFSTKAPFSTHKEVKKMQKAIKKLHIRSFMF